MRFSISSNFPLDHNLWLHSTVNSTKRRLICLTWHRNSPLLKWRGYFLPVLLRAGSELLHATALNTWGSNILPNHPESIDWFIEEQAFLRSYHSTPRPPPYHLSREPNHTTAGNLALYNYFNTLCYRLSYNVPCTPFPANMGRNYYLLPSPPLFSEVFVNFAFIYCEQQIVKIQYFQKQVCSTNLWLLKVCGFAVDVTLYL